MEIFVYGIYGDEIRLKGVTDTVTQLRWTRRFYSCDEFEMLLPVTENNLEIFTENTIVELKGKCSGIITSIDIFRREGFYSIKAEGCSFDGLFRRRVLVDHKDGDSLLTIIDRNCGNLADEIRRFPCIEVDYSCDCQTDIAEAHRFRSLAGFVNAACQLDSLGVLSELAHEKDRHYIRIYGKRPKDRTASQNTNRKAVFSDRYESFGKAAYSYSENGAMTGAVVYSESKYLYDTYIPEWHGIYGDASAGFGRCEKAYKIQPRIKYIPRTIDGRTVYVPALDEESTQRYGEFVHMSNYSEFSENMQMYLTLKEDYTKDFDVGDRITVECSRFGKVLDRTVYQVTEFYSHRGYTAVAEVGE